MPEGIIIDLSAPQSSTSVEELNFYLSKAIESYRDLKKCINKNTSLGYLCILMSSTITGGIISTPEVSVPGTGIKIDATLAVPMLAFIASLFFVVKDILFLWTKLN